MVFIHKGLISQVASCRKKSTFNGSSCMQDPANYLAVNSRLIGW